MDQKRLEAYADLIVKKGLNLDKGQEVLLIAGLDQVEFVRMTVEKCYQAGAAKVVVNWTDMATEKLDHIYQSEETLSEVESWVLAKWQWRADKLPALYCLAQ